MAQPPAGQRWSRRRFLVTVGGAAVTGLIAGTGMVEFLAHPAPTDGVIPTGSDLAARATTSPTPSAVATGPAPSPTPSATAAVAYHTSGIRGVSLPLEERYFSRQPVLPAHPSWPVDRDGVPIIKRGTVVVQHPVDLASMGLQLVDSYAQTHAVTYRDQAQAIAKRLVTTGRKARGGLYLGYSFDFRLHGRAADLLRAPWYSAMAQGMALALFVRLYEMTGDDAHLANARLLFVSLADQGVRTQPWVSRLDPQGYLWLEEYPAKPPDQTLNGFQFATFGLYDYDQAVHGADSAAILDGALTTVKHYLPAFRHPGDISYYCLAHHVVSAHYHDIVIRQLGKVAQMTGDPDFAAAADQLRADHP